MRQQEELKRTWLSEVKVGSVLTGVIAGAKNGRVDENACLFTMFDKTGELEAMIPAGRNNGVIEDGIYVFEMSVVIKKGHKTAIVKEWRKAERTDAYSPMDIYTGLDPERILLYQKVIRGAIATVEKQDKDMRGFYTLLNLYFTGEEMEVLARRPASVNGVGRYAGGALALVTNLAVLTKDFAYDLQKMGNGLYGEQCDYALMITACLLSMAGIAEYVGDDSRKSPKGLARGYYSVLQTRLEPLMEQAGVAPYEQDKLFNMLHCMFPGTGALKSVTWEASICRAIMALYTEVDEVAAYLAEAPSEEDLARGYRYSERLNRMFVIPMEQTAAAEGKAGDAHENAS